MDATKVVIVESIPPRQRKPYVCPTQGVPIIPGMSIIIRLEYTIRPFPFISWRSVREVPFSLKVSSSGEPYWVEGNYLGGRGPEIYDGM